MAGTTRPAIRAARWRITLTICAAALFVGGCDDGQSVEVDEDYCSAIMGDGSIATGCVVVEGRISDLAGAGVGSVNVALDCFATDGSGCHVVPTTTESDGTDHALAHDLNQAGGPGWVVVRAYHLPTDRRAESDTVDVVFAALRRWPRGRSSRRWCSLSPSACWCTGSWGRTTRRPADHDRVNEKSFCTLAATGSPSRMAG
jgi:hypothetical protein